ncbi:unnamed protein product, partial [Gulo gulo]
RLPRRPVDVVCRPAVSARQLPGAHLLGLEPLRTGRAGAAGKGAASSPSLVLLAADHHPACRGFQAQDKYLSAHTPGSGDTKATTNPQPTATSKQHETLDCSAPKKA